MCLKSQDDDFNVEEELAKIVTPETKPGDLYQLGDHRLLCGNSLDGKDVMKLMGDDRASMVFSDPPYNINLDYRKGIGTKGKYTTDKLVDDNKGVKEYEQFLERRHSERARGKQSGCAYFLLVRREIRVAPPNALRKTWRQKSAAVLLGEK